MKRLPETVAELAADIGCSCDDEGAIRGWIYSDPVMSVPLLFALVYEGYDFPWEVRVA